MLKELNLDVVKKVIKNHYLDDINFPRSCGSISMILTVIFQQIKQGFPFLNEL